jgi:hypothetical protein
VKREGCMSDIIQDNPLKGINKEEAILLKKIKMKTT